MFPVVMGHIPGGCNIKQPLHYIQLQNSDRFCQYDYDPKENQRLYGRLTPPDYRLERITAPVALYYGSNDYLSAVEDVQRLAKLLPNVVENHMYRKWNHMDLIWAISARRSIQPRILQVMQYWEAGGAAKDVTTVTPVEEEVAQLTTGSPVDENLEEDEAAGTIAGNEEQREKVPQDHLEGDLVKAATDPTSEL